MSSHLRRLPSPAMGVALLALFVALGGTGYAATTILHRSSASAAKKAKVLRGPRGPRGPRGLAGKTGPVGPMGAAGANGAPGAPGRSALTPLGAGETERGSSAWTQKRQRQLVISAPPCSTRFRSRPHHRMRLSSGRTRARVSAPELWMRRRLLLRHCVSIPLRHPIRASGPAITRSDQSGWDTSIPDRMERQRDRRYVLLRLLRDHRIAV